VAASNIHAENTRLFRETNAVERTIIQQIVAAINTKYLKALRNTVTNKITASIPQIFTHLFDAYGDITPQELRELRQQVENYTFTPTEPVDSVFAEIDDLSDMSTIARSPITQQQKIDYGYLILQRTLRFKSGLNTWNRKAAADKTWANFKTHFCDVQKELRRTGELTVEEGINNTEELINLVAESLQQALKQNQAPQDENFQAPTINHTGQDDVHSQLAEMRDMIKAMANAQSNFSMTAQGQGYHVNAVAQQQYQQTNAPFQDITNTTHQQQYQQGGYNGGQYRNQQFQPQYNGGRGYQQSRGGRGGRGGRGKPRANPNTNKYCWTHGGCNHFGNQCEFKADGHQENATFRSKLGGNTKNCYTS
jgi:hypothetical protein